MEEKHGNSKGGAIHYHTCDHSGVDGVNAQTHMELDQKKCPKPIPPSQRIITDCC